MAKKATSRKTSGTKKTPAATRRRQRALAVATDGEPASYRAKVRMYRHGLGDCHLIRLPRVDDKERDFFILIDCGIVLGTPDASSKMQAVAEDIVATTNGHVDLLLVTHEHWDHVSGFIQAREAFEKLKVDEIWLAWTEDPQDKLAQKLRQEKEVALAALRLGASRLQLAAGDGAAADLEGILEFFGAGKGASTKDALAAVREMNPKNIRYRRPSDTAEAPRNCNGVRFYIMGPPPDEKLLKRTNPSKANHEGFGLALAGFDAQIAPVLSGEQLGPFDPIYAIPSEVAEEIDFFKSRYFDHGKTGSVWRRIDSAWLDGLDELALQLDNMTNNTSLVLAIEFPDGEVLLFVADAQVGNWLSWQDLSWEVKGKAVTGPDLMQRAIFYKVGHHGSHNATLRDKGLGMMPNLQFAFIPVDHAMAVKKRWGKMPLPEIVAELNKKTGGKVFQSDMPAGTRVPKNVVATPLFFELTL